MASKEPSNRRGLAAAIEAMRLHQWSKNAFVLAALVYSRHLDQEAYLLKSLGAFLAFGFTASGIYIHNDLKDVESDRNHPSKRFRPIASGRLGPGPARIVSWVSLAAGFSLAYAVRLEFLWVVLAYFVQNLLYSSWLKHVVLLDVFVIANGFVLRAFGGAVALGVDFSQWLLLCTVTLSLFLGFSKRRSEMVELGEDAGSHRGNLRDYSLGLLDQLIGVSASCTLLTYALTCKSPEVIERVGSPYLILTTPFVFYGIFRYLFLLHRTSQATDPARALLSDRPLLGTCVLWALVTILLVYGPIRVHGPT